MNFTIATGQCWRQCGDSGIWRVVAISYDGIVCLTGPGPARSIQTVDSDDLSKDWELVELDRE